MELEYLPLNVSGVQLYWECRRKWYYADKYWGLGYSLPYLADGKALLGTWVHYALALVYRGFSYRAAFEQTLSRQAEMEDLYGDWGGDKHRLVETLDALLEAHQLWQVTDTSWYSDRNLEWVYPEFPFEVEHNGILIRGIIDGIVRHKQTGEFLLVERKTSSNPGKIEQGVLYDLQPRVYLAVVEKIFKKPVGILYELIRATNPNQVKLLKNGLPSKALTELVGTTYEVYLALLQQRADPLNYTQTLLDYKSQLEWLRQNPDPIFRRTLHIFSDNARQSGLNFLEVSFPEMVQQRKLGSSVVPTGLNRHHCGYCQFRDVCAAQDDGVDWEAMLSTLYIKDAIRFDNLE